jgi:hypothetical protein
MGATGLRAKDLDHGNGIRTRTSPQYRPGMGSWKPPREDVRPARRPQPYRGSPATVRDVRQHGVTELRIYCTDLVCNHCGRLLLAPVPDDLVLLTLDPR